MYLFNSETRSRGRRKVVGDNLSPILKENAYMNRAPAANNETTDLISKLNSVKIDTDKKLNSKVVNVTAKNEIRDCKKITVKVSKRSPKKPEKENESGVKEVNKSDKPKINLKRVTKKKDSFIVSDDSSIANDSMTMYHQILTERIRVDVRKVTPRTRLRKRVSTNDDGIFTPYVIGKRSCSESSLSDEENNRNDNWTKPKSPKTDVHPSIGRTIGLSSDKNYEKDDSSDLFSTFESKRRNRQPLTPARVPAISRNFLKDYSWIFSDDDSFNSEKKLSTNEKNSNVNLKLTSPSDEKLPSKYVNTNERVLVTPSPITFRLKKVKNLTPKLNAYQKDEHLSFLKSLSTFSSPCAIHPDAERYRKSFKKLKEELASKLFKMFNEKVFDRQLPSDMKIEWSARLRSSSGLCYNKRIKNVVESNNECLRTSRIALSTKIIETPDRLRDTLIHEMCHAAAWIIDNKSDGHGPHWRAWASKAMKSFPELPSIRRCHDYSVKTKFKYKCVKCGYTIGRHSKSLNLERKRCGFCYGQFELFLNHENVTKSNLNRTHISPKNASARPLSKFALFVKDNYGKMKSEKPTLKHGEIMKELGKHFAATKNTN